MTHVTITRKEEVIFQKQPAVQALGRNCHLRTLIVPIRVLSQTGSLHETAQHVLGGEILLGNLTGRPAVPCIIALNRADRRQDVRHIPKSEEPAADWEDVTEGSVLSHDGFSRG